MTEQAKPTAGPVEISSYLHGLYKVDIVADGGRKVVATVTVKDVPVHRDLPPADNLEGWANAHLIADAFNVYHETGLTPSQLKEQRDALDFYSSNQALELAEIKEQRAELLEALEGAIGALEQDVDAGENEDDAEWIGIATQRLEAARAAIAKARGGSDA